MRALPAKDLDRQSALRACAAPGSKATGGGLLCPRSIAGIAAMILRAREDDGARNAPPGVGTSDYAQENR